MVQRPLQLYQQQQQRRASIRPEQALAVLLLIDRIKLFLFNQSTESTFAAQLQQQQQVSPKQVERQQQRRAHQPV